MECAICSHSRRDALRMENNFLESYGSRQDLAEVNFSIPASSQQPSNHCITERQVGFVKALEQLGRLTSFVSDFEP